VAKKSKIEPENKGTDPAGSAPAVGNGSETAAPKKKARPAAAKPKGKKPATKKTAATPARSSAKKSSSPSAVREPSDDEIRLRAYFLAERRHQLSLPGDSAHDWIEARRQLLDEAHSGT
jgi:hypothetical protein